MSGKRVVIIGGVALGPKAACRLKRLEPDADVLIIDQDEYISYGGCGIPYFISGDISDVRELMSTSFHMERTPQFFRDAKDVRVRTRTRALAIDRANRRVRVRDLVSGVEEDLPYDRLVIATGSTPNKPPIPGIGLPGVIAVSDLHSAIEVKDKISGGKVDRAVIVGAGAIGCEMAEALGDLWGIETHVVEIEDQVLPGILDRSLAGIVRTHLEEKGVRLHLGRRVTEIRKNGGEGDLEVIMPDGSIHAELVITAAGVRPNSELAGGAGLLVSPSGAIVVNKMLQTSDPDIYAGGDCIEIPHLVSGKAVHFPQGSLANRQGRVIGTNLAGGSARFDGTVGSFAIKVFDLAVASAGLTPQAALKSGFEAEPVLVVQADRAHFYPTQDLIYFLLTVDRKTRRILGAQAVGANGDAVVGRINAIAAILPFKPTVEDVSNLEIAYSPPFASALDVVNAAGNTAENILDGLNRPIGPDEFQRCFLLDESADCLCLDVRGPANAAPFVERYGDRWLNIPQETLNARIGEVPRDKRLLLMCNSGVRSYEAMRRLDQAGIDNTVNVQGGVALLKKSGRLDRSQGGGTASQD
ncbi:MAG: FAD-dependent oxidoreductase [Syntrophobacteraceae bacterium]|jgi:NADPH-dependent 2,4-dienoyl-CoA reductase/sulfur reductase-like enzyme/rhodanese-related sulfurtransferase